MVDDNNELHAVSSRLGAVEADVAALKTLIPIVERIEARVNQPPDRANWPAIGALLVAVLTVSATYVNTRMGPVESSVNDNRNRIRGIATKLGADSNIKAQNAVLVAAALDLSERSIQQNSKSAQRIAALEALLDSLETEVQNIDQHGSRRWIDEK